MQNKQIRERAEKAAAQMEEVFSAFVIIGLPLDKKQMPNPLMITSGSEEAVRNLVVVANSKVK